MSSKFLHTCVPMLLALLAACGGGGGGGGGSDGPAGGGDPQGAFSGDVTRAAAAATNFDLLVLDDGSYFGFVGGVDGDDLAANVTAVLQGAGSIDGSGAFNSANGREFRFGDPAAVDAPIDEAVFLGASAVGAVESENGRLTFSAAYAAAYDMPMSLANIAGSYTGFVRRLAGGTAPLSATIAADGSVTASSGSCVISGSVTPRPGGKRPLALVLNYQAASCGGTALALSGVAFNSTPTRIIFAAVTADRNDVLFSELRKN